MSASPQRVAMVPLLWLGLFACLPAMAASPIEPPLTRVRTWTLAASDLDAAQSRRSAHRLRLQMAVLSGTRWTPEVILDAAKRSAAIFAQCDIQIDSVQLHQFDGPQRYRYLSTSDSREFAARSKLEKPAVYFVEDTLQRPAFDAEAIGRSNAKERPEMADTVWITAAIRDLPIALAHELVHVLADSGDHSHAADNLMREDTAPGNTHLTRRQCSTIVANGKANGLLDSSSLTR